MIEPFRIESESEADEYLKNLLAKKDCQSMTEVERRAKELIKSQELQNYFIEKARQILNV